MDLNKLAPKCCESKKYTLIVSNGKRKSFGGNDLSNTPGKNIVYCILLSMLSESLKEDQEMSNMIRSSEAVLQLLYKMSQKSLQRPWCRTC